LQLGGEKTTKRRAAIGQSFIKAKILARKDVEEARENYEIEPGADRTKGGNGVHGLKIAALAGQEKMVGVGEKGKERGMVELSVTKIPVSRREL